MPHVNIRAIKGALSEEQKEELFQRITDILIDGEGKGGNLSPKSVIITLEEEDPENWIFDGIEEPQKQVSSVTD